MKTSVENDSGFENRRCNYCGIRGHLKIDCRKWAASEKKKSELNDSSSTHGSKKVSAKEVEVNMADVGLAPWDDPVEVTVSNLDLTIEDDEAVFDTGATHDVFNLLSHFIDLQEIEPIPVTLANGSSKAMITGVGRARVESPYNSSMGCVLPRVYYCKALKHNLVSGVSMFDLKKFFHTDERGLGFNVDGGLMRAKIVSRKWVLRVSCPGVTIRSVNSYDTWHQQLGHPHDRVLQAMAQSNMVLGLPDRLGPATPCETCAKAKSTKSTAIGPFFCRHDRILHLVVADLCGPFQERSVVGAQYFNQIRDVYSTFVRVSPLVNKYDATSVVKSYVAEVERLTGEKIVYWRKDGGGEFLNKSLETFFVEKGISLEKTLRYHHEQAGIIERSQRTVQSIMQCLLFGSDLPISFWSLAATKAAYLHN